MQDIMEARRWRIQGFKHLFVTMFGLGGAACALIFLSQERGFTLPKSFYKMESFQQATQDPHSASLAQPALYGSKQYKYMLILFTSLSVV
jgi:hypothetical protein